MWQESLMSFEQFMIKQKYLKNNSQNGKSKRAIAEGLIYNLEILEIYIHVCVAPVCCWCTSRFRVRQLKLRLDKMYTNYDDKYIKAC